jgi:hypothetical protein
LGELKAEPMVAPKVKEEEISLWRK